MKTYLVVLTVVYSVVAYTQTLTIDVPANTYGIDENLSIIVSRLGNIEEYQNIENYNEIIISLDENAYKFISNPNSLAYSNSYTIQSISTAIQYTLYFTKLPIVHINTEVTIPDEPKVPATLIYTDKEQTITSFIGIELRGGSSQAYPKKTYDIEFWDDQIGEETKDVQFGELREDDDWILDALYNEPLRIRSYAANKLWKQMVIPYYIDEEPEAKSGADVMYVEMFLKGHYNGVYNLSEQVDRKQLKLKKYKGEMRGELYKGSYWGGANTFTELPAYNNLNRIWGGYELKYPDKDQITDWDNVYQFTDFVMNASQSDFESTIWSQFVEDNFIDYFLFLNLIYARDNTGKNLYLAKYKAEEPYFYVPWDLDGCFGTDYQGQNVNITNDIVTNGFMFRVMNENSSNTFINLANKWFDYREDIFSDNSLSEFITNQYNFLKENKVYERESLVYPNYLFDNADLSYILNWIENRLNYLDTYFGNTLSVNTFKLSNNLNIYPNPVGDRTHIDIQGIPNTTNYKIYNSLGQLMQSSTIENQQIEVKNLERGIYYISIDQKYFKLIKN